MRVLATIALLAVATSAAEAQTPATQGRPAALIHHQVSNVAVAQAAFDRGLLDYYAYNPEAAELAFYTAADLDKHLAMAFWGIAVANAPNLNVDATDDRNEQATEAIQQAKKLEQYASPEDAAFIDAAAARFDGDPKVSAQVKLVAYRDALQKIAAQYPNDPNAAALYAEAALYVVVGNVYEHRSELTPAQHVAFRTAAAALLPYYEAELLKFPQQIGLLHFFIHAAQMAGDSQAAVGAAKQLAAFAFPPEDSHLTHMPGHTFFDVGMYDAAADVGQRSVAMDAAEIACCHPGYYSAARYYHAHNVAFLLYALTQTGHLDEAIQVARTDGDVNYITRQLVAAGRWSDAVALTYSKFVRPGTTYARAIAYAKLGDAAKAQATIAVIAPTASSSPYDKALDTAMTSTVAAEIALDQRNDAAALQALTAASTAMTNALTIEPAEYPPLYFYSPHMALARLAEALGKPQVARQALEAELAASPRSSAALAMLAQLR